MSSSRTNNNSIADALHWVGYGRPVERHPVQGLPLLTGYAGFIVRGVRAQDERRARERLEREQQQQQQQAQEEASTVPAPLGRKSLTSLNPEAPCFSPPHAPSTSLPTIPRAPPMPTKPTTTTAPPPSKPLLVYTEWSIIRNPTKNPPSVVLPRLKDVSADCFYADGSVIISITFAISAAGYAHYEPGPGGRAQLVKNTWMRDRRYGLPPSLLRFLCGEVAGSSVVVPAKEAEKFWKRKESE